MFAGMPWPDGWLIDQILNLSDESSILSRGTKPEMLTLIDVSANDVRFLWSLYRGACYRSRRRERSAEPQVSSLARSTRTPALSSTVVRLASHKPSSTPFDVIGN